MQNILNDILLTNAARETERATAAKNQTNELKKFNKMLNAFYYDVEANQI